MPVDREERARLRAEKAARKAEQAEFRRTAKQLRSSDVAKRLDAIARVAEGRYLTDGDCLGPLLESLVVKKKTAAAVPRALKVLAAFFAPKGTCRPGALRIFEPADAVGTRCRGVDLISQHIGVVDGLPPHGGAAVAAVRCLRGLASAIHSAEDGEAAVLAPLFAEQGATAERILAFLAACATAVARPSGSIGTSVDAESTCALEEGDDQAALAAASLALEAADAAGGPAALLVDAMTTLAFVARSHEPSRALLHHGGAAATLLRFLGGPHRAASSAAMQLLQLCAERAEGVAALVDAGAARAVLARLRDLAGRRAVAEGAMQGGAARFDADDAREAARGARVLHTLLRGSLHRAEAALLAPEGGAPGAGAAALPAALSRLLFLAGRGALPEHIAAALAGSCARCCIALTEGHDGARRLLGGAGAMAGALACLGRFATAASKSSHGDRASNATQEGCGGAECAIPIVPEDPWAPAAARRALERLFHSIITTEEGSVDPAALAGAPRLGSAADAALSAWAPDTTFASDDVVGGGPAHEDRTSHEHSAPVAPRVQGPWLSLGCLVAGVQESDGASAASAICTCALSRLLCSSAASVALAGAPAARCLLGVVRRWTSCVEERQRGRIDAGEEANAEGSSRGEDGTLAASADAVCAGAGDSRSGPAVALQPCVDDKVAALATLALRDIAASNCEASATGTFECDAPSTLAVLVAPESIELLLRVLRCGPISEGEFLSGKRCSASAGAGAESGGHGSEERSRSAFAARGGCPADAHISIVWPSRAQEGGDAADPAMEGSVVVRAAAAQAIARIISCSGVVNGGDTGPDKAGEGAAGEGAPGAADRALEACRAASELCLQILCCDLEPSECREEHREEHREEGPPPAPAPPHVPYAAAFLGRPSSASSKLLAGQLSVGLLEVLAAAASFPGGKGREALLAAAARLPRLSSLAAAESCEVAHATSADVVAAAPGPTNERASCAKERGDGDVEEDAVAEAPLPSFHAPSRWLFWGALSDGRAEGSRGAVNRCSHFVAVVWPLLAIIGSPAELGAARAVAFQALGALCCESPLPFALEAAADPAPYTPMEAPLPTGAAGALVETFASVCVGLGGLVALQVAEDSSEAPSFGVFTCAGGTSPERRDAWRFGTYLVGRAADREAYWASLPCAPDPQPAEDAATAANVPSKPEPKRSGKRGRKDPKKAKKAAARREAVPAPAAAPARGAPAVRSAEGDPAAPSVPPSLGRADPIAGPTREAWARLLSSSACDLGMDMRRGDALAAAVLRRHHRWLLLLLSAGARPDGAARRAPALSPLQMALMLGDAASVDALVAGGADCDGSVEGDDDVQDHTRTLKIAIAMPPPLEAAARTVAAGRRRRTGGASAGIGPDEVREAVAKERLRVLQLLLDNGADPNLSDESGSYPLHSVLIGASVPIPIVKAFSRARAAAEAAVAAAAAGVERDGQAATRPGSPGAQPFDASAFFGRDKIAGSHAAPGAALAAPRIADPVAVWRMCERDRTLLCDPCADGALVQVVASLCGRGADVNAANLSGRTPLHCACIAAAGTVGTAGSAEIPAFRAAKLLLQHGAHANVVDEAHCTPLHYTCAGAARGADGLVDALLAAGSGRAVYHGHHENRRKFAPSKASRTALDAGATLDDLFADAVEPVSVALRRASRQDLLNAVSRHGCTPLHLAAGGWRAEVTEAVARHAAVALSRSLPAPRSFDPAGPAGAPALARSPRRRSPAAEPGGVRAMNSPDPAIQGGAAHEAAATEDAEHRRCLLRKERDVASRLAGRANEVHGGGASSTDKCAHRSAQLLHPLLEGAGADAGSAARRYFSASFAEADDQAAAVLAVPLDPRLPPTAVDGEARARAARALLATGELDAAVLTRSGQSAASLAAARAAADGGAMLLSLLKSSPAGFALSLHAAAPPAEVLPSGQPALPRVMREALKLPTRPFSATGLRFQPLHYVIAAEAVSEEASRNELANSVLQAMGSCRPRPSDVLPPLHFAAAVGAGANVLHLLITASVSAADPADDHRCAAVLGALSSPSPVTLESHGDRRLVEVLGGTPLHCAVAAANVHAAAALLDAGASVHAVDSLERDVLGAALDGLRERDGLLAEEKGFIERICALAGAASARRNLDAAAKTNGDVLRIVLRTLGEGAQVAVRAVCHGKTVLSSAEAALLRLTDLVAAAGTKEERALIDGQWRRQKGIVEALLTASDKERGAERVKQRAAETPAIKILALEVVESAMRAAAERVA